jgi:hypothetical protein
MAMTSARPYGFLLRKAFVFIAIVYHAFAGLPKMVDVDIFVPFSFSKSQLFQDFAVPIYSVIVI